MSDIRDRVWKNLANIKFKGIYCSKCSRRAEQWGKLYSFLLSFTSAASVASWALWQKLPDLWAFLVAVAQALHVAKPYIPFLGNEKDYLEMSYEFRALYLEYERLWFSMESGELSNSEIESRFYEYRRKEADIERNHSECPRFERLVLHSQRETYEFTNFQYGSPDVREEKA